MSERKSQNDGALLQNEDKSTQNIGISGYASFDQFTKDGYKVLMEAIRNSNSLPNGRDWSFYNAHQSFTQIVSEEGNSILKQINYILRNNKIEGNVRNRVLEEKTELMVEANDMILERVANNLDEMNGIRKTVVEPVLIQTVSAQLPINGSWNRVNNATFSVSSSITSEPFKKTGNAIRLLAAKNILRPQKFFKDKIINSSTYPWVPRIKEKPNSLKPLAIFLEKTERGEEYSHPYEFELDKFTPLPAQLKREVPLKPIKVKDTPLIEVNQPEQIEELIATLRGCKEFAVDLEHHSYRSFMGITCLMQISTTKEDYLIDTIALRDKLYMLNEVFTKPSIVKIFHGADMDIQWLQRDLSIYVVNMFDTYQAAKQLEYPALSLAYLMQKFCDFIPNKQFQLADWRIRPLPEELKSYAREDTHYLIYIHQMLKNELLDKDRGQDNILLSVLNNSTETCKKRYFKPVLKDDSYLDFYRKCKRLFDNRQLYALKELYKWRDEISREEDESTGYVLPNHMLLQISENLPREMQGILACCNPIPPLVRANLLELHHIVLRAKEQPLDKPILKEDTRARGTTLKISKINVDSPLHCPHDLTSATDFRDNLPTLIGNESLNLKNLVNHKLQIENNASIYTVFNAADTSEEEIALNTNKGLKKLQSITFLGPFERYKLVKPFIQAEEERLAAEKLETERVVIETSESVISQEDTRTDEERIESIRRHFLNLSRPTTPATQEIPPNQTLIQMGGSKKRKRDPTPQKKPDCYPSETFLQTTVADINVYDNPQKRKSSNLADGDSPHKVGKFNGDSLSGRKQKFNRKNNKKKQNDSQGEENHGEQSHCQKTPATVGHQYQGYSDQRNINTGQSNSCFQNESDINTDHSSFHIDKSGSKNRFKPTDGQRADFRGRGGKGGKHRNKNKIGQQANQFTENQDFTPYDYSSVDFRQFQGGAGGQQRSQDFKSNFKSKGKKKNGNKGYNKGSSFGNSGKGGRRGR